MSVKAEWIAVDWGTSHLRVWAIQDTRAVGEARSDKGMGRLARSEFQDALLELAGGWLDDAPVDVIACGMVGARQGWVEAPYATVPVAPLSGAPIRVPQTDPRIRAYVVPGLKQLKPTDVMRGEETQIAGFLALNKDWDGVICLPGTHSKWVHVSAGEVVSFQTFMTGEMFDLLSKTSVLRHSVGDGWYDDAFREAVETTLSKPESVAARLFGIRASDLLEATEGAVSRARLSGLLIGAELAAARPYWLGQQIALIGASGMSEIYAKALELQGVPATVADGQHMTLAGLNAARKLLEH
ncbi:2-dehydro-3-deoxygalactonokinase [Ruegeria sp. 2205SS24-7]|uniref:2-dehydro-3-deoxygalactonokinase n=1 Tax=Ruegeria discodermiae TaxID=3064389 RepID=UPI0027423180|nr:2-dehydro-3-deoxygalactonokinase [Ruegeria sp. 2205SS24-7]MDP5217184.1 2-dehydro-3-deoxygalactonokinase [Ruegeria sp. 2205SS24-7]